MSFANQQLGTIAVHVPGATALFRELEIDFCCGGARTLSAAAEAKNLDLAQIEARLTELANNQPTENDQDSDVYWLNAPYAEMTDFIIKRYHDVHRAQLPELIELAETVERVHAERAECPQGLAAELRAIFEELSNHTMKEERILFPMINAGNYAMAQIPIRVMEMEHEQMGDQLEVLKKLTNHFVPPADACNTWQALYRGIAQFTDDLVMHTHRENNILFPRVLAEIR